MLAGGVAPTPEFRVTSLVRRSVLALATAAVPALAAAQQAAPLPLKHTPTSTVAEITAADLMTRLYIFADDSMMGREAGTPGGIRGTEYIASELKKLGLKPAGDNGTYFQDVPLVKRAPDGDKSSLSVDGSTLVWGTDFLFTAIGELTPMSNAPVVFGGVFGDSAGISGDAAKGKFIVFAPARPGAGGGQRAMMASLGKYAGAAGIAMISGFPTIPPAMANAQRTPRIMLPGAPLGAGLPSAIITLTPSAAAKLLGTPVDSAMVGMGS
jgi:hypothetical protein